MDNTIDNSRKSKIEQVDVFLKKHQMSVKTILMTGNFWKWADNDSYSDHEVKKICAFFSGLSLKDFSSDSMPLPPEEKWGLEKKTEKLRFLNEWLFSHKGIRLDRAISVATKKMAKCLAGAEVPSKRILRMTADYFFMDTELLTDDDKELPSEDSLTIDEDLAAIQADDFKAHAESNKNKHVIRRNWRILSHSQRVGLVFSLLGVLLPLVAFTGYCAYTESADRAWAEQAYRNDSMSQEAQKIASSLNQKGTFTTVRMGSQEAAISSINSSSYDVSMTLWFDFDQLEFHKTMCQLNTAIASYEKEMVNHSGWKEEYRLIDQISYNSTSGLFADEKDGIPDFLESDFRQADFSDTSTIKASFATSNPNPIYKAEVSCYPGQVSTNNYADNTNMFSLERGSFDSDSFSYDAITPYTLKDTSSLSFRVFQKCSFSATIMKDTYGPRYPLDSAQFYIYVQPKFTSDYFRYEAVDLVSLSSSSEKTICTYGTAEPTDYITGLASYFKVANGYQLISSSLVTSHLTRLDYSGTYQGDDANGNPIYSGVKTHYVVLTRVNRSGPGLFLQAFANIFAITIWIIIACYDQAYNASDSIGMLGTGLFGIISSVLVGISMVSNADIFSLITMINIFTLFVIILMTYEAVVAKRAAVKKNKVAMAYNAIKLRFMFYIIVCCTLAMFIGLPLICYIFF